MKKLFILILSLFFITSCGTKYEEYNRVSVDEAKNYIVKEILDRNGDKVRLELVTEKVLEHCIVRDDTCSYYDKVNVASEFIFRAINIDNEDINYLVTYKDSYIYDGVKIKSEVLVEDYINYSKVYSSNKTIQTILDQYNILYNLKYDINASNYHYIYLYTEDYEVLGQLCNALLLLYDKDSIRFDLFVFKNKDYYDSMDFSEPLDTFKSLFSGRKELGSSSGYDKELLELDNDNNNLIYKFSTDGCTGRGCSTLMVIE